MSRITPQLKRRDPLVNTDSYPAELSPLLKRLYANRGVQDVAQFQLGLQALPKPNSLSGLAAATEVLSRAVQQQRTILLVGDFDADGATSCALGLRALKMFGCSANYLVPNRFEYGYGLSPEIVEVAAAGTAELSKPEVIITVDNGISSIAGAKAAAAHGIELVITDHHLPGDELPQAAAIVNPNVAGDDFPSKCLAGVGVIFYVMLALRAELRQAGWFAKQAIAEPNLAELLDLVALGTVADLVPLDHCNRVLVEQGLRRIRAGRCVPGILALLEVAKRDYRRAVASDMGFAVGPRLNAAGRLDDMSLGIECLLTDSSELAREHAAELDGLNRERREVEASMQAEAIQVVDKLLLKDRSELPAALCLFEESWHPGVVGLVAGRTKDAIHRPVIAFAPECERMLKGSARSIPGLHIRDALAAIDASQPGLLGKFGGHTMAAGLSIDRKNLPKLQLALAEYVEQHLADEHRLALLMTDGELPLEDINLDNAEELRLAGPWGQAFPEPVFDGEFEVLTVRQLRDNHVKFTFGEPGRSELADAIYFRFPGQVPQVGDRVKVAYRLDVNQFQGRRFPQLLLEYLSPA